MTESEVVVWHFVVVVFGEEGQPRQILVEVDHEK